MPDFRGLFVYTITKGHQHEADDLFRYLRETMNSATINPKGKITISCIGGRGRRIRTLGTRFWRPLLYQLSYAPMKNTHDAIFRIVGIVLELLSRFELLTSSLPRMRSTS